MTVPGGDTESAATLATDGEPSPRNQPVAVDDAPAVLTSAGSILVAILTLQIVAGDGLGWSLFVLIGGLLVVAAGRQGRTRGFESAGRLVVVAGLAVLLGAVWLASAGATPGMLLRRLPGVVGIVLLGTGLVLDTRPRAALVVGTGGVVVSVFVAGIFRTVGFGSLALATAGAVVAWDLGARAISISDQLGRGATTRRLEVVAVGTTTLVAGLAVLVTHVVQMTATSTVSRESFVVSFVALLLLLAALRR